MQKPSFLRLIISLLALASFGTACNLPVQTMLPTAFALQPSPTLAPPTGTARPPADTAAPVPTDTTNPTLTSVPPTATPTSMTVKIYLIAIDDGGASGPAVGCGDSAVAVDVEVPYSVGVLRAALEKLLSIRRQYYGESGLYDALYQSDLAVADVNIDAGHADIHLTGTLTQGGECDSPRIEAQLTKTALQFPTVHSVSIYINGTLLEDLLSLRG
jgi:hypothetical protein